MQAIETKYIAPTNTKGARIKATCARGSIMMNYQHGLSHDDCHVVAAYSLTAKFVAEDKQRYGSDPAKNPWNRTFITGQLKNGNHVHVFPS